MQPRAVGARDEALANDEPERRSGARTDPGCSVVQKPSIMASIAFAALGLLIAPSEPTAFARDEALLTSSASRISPKTRTSTCHLATPSGSHERREAGSEGPRHARRMAPFFSTRESSGLQSS